MYFDGEIKVEQNLDDTNWAYFEFSMGPKFQDMFGHQDQTTIFIFQTHLHTFQYTFSSTRISKNFKKFQTTILKSTYQMRS